VLNISIVKQLELCCIFIVGDFSWILEQSSLYG